MIHAATEGEEGRYVGSWNQVHTRGGFPLHDQHISHGGNRRQNLSFPANSGVNQDKPHLFPDQGYARGVSCDFSTWTSRGTDHTLPH